MRGPLAQRLNGFTFHLLLFCVACTVASAQRASPGRAEELPRESTAIADVVMPVPSQIFGSLDRFADSDWRRVQRLELVDWRPRGGQVEIALRLGVVIAEGFIAVQAHDAVEVKGLGRAARALTRGLGVERAALRRNRSIVEHAEAGDWRAVREEWNHVLPDVHEGMRALQSQDLAQVVSLAGWLRGTEAVTVLVLQHYSADDAELLRQPALLDQFEKQLARMSPEIRTRPLIGRMREALGKIRRLLSLDEPELSREQLKQIGAVCEELRKAIGAKR